MTLQIPNKIRWQKPVLEDSLACYRPKIQKRMRGTLSKLPQTTITHSFEPLTDEAIAWFQPLYDATIGNKPNSVLYDIRTTTLEKNPSIPYMILTIYEDEAKIGATIFSMRKDRINVAYRVFQQKWQAHTLQINPTLYSDYLVTDYARAHSLHFVSHGKDRNPYGINAAIGLATFKLSAGCTAFLPQEYDILEIEEHKITSDALIFLHPKETKQITDAILYTTPERVTHYDQLMSYADRVSIEIKLLQEH